MYIFNTVRLMKNRLTGESYVNPAKSFSKISQTEQVPPDTLNPPQSQPMELTTLSITGEVVGVQKCSLTFCCMQSL